MAPEIIMGEADVDSRADVYALGCVAYYLLTGTLVFEAETPMKMLLQHAHAKPVPPSQRTELPIPRELDELVLACLEKDPNDRPQSAEELFRMAVGCQACEGWSQASARAWWKTHLPDLTGPLTVSELDTLTRSAPLSLFRSCILSCGRDGRLALPSSPCTSWPLSLPLPRSRSRNASRGARA